MESVKDRIGFKMIEAPERDGNIGPDRMVAEFTLGNTGIALTNVCAMKGYRLILTMLVIMLAERRKMLLLLGAKLDLITVLEGTLSNIARAVANIAELGDAAIPQEYANSANPSFHRRTTAIKIWHHTDGNLDVKIAGVGAAGTLTGYTGISTDTTLVFE